MLVETDSDRPRPEPAKVLRHGCWLVALVGAITLAALVIVGSFALIGPLELGIVVLVVASAVITGDRWRARGTRNGERGGGR